ncbi:MAG: ATP-binding protein, partial [Nitrospiria bacterium]
VGSVWFEMHHAPLRDDQGQVIGVVGVAVDLTDQKRIEEEVSRASTLESIGVLAGGIAHDFNNMLMAIVGNLSLAKLLVDREGKVFQRIDESQKAAMRARTLTQQLLTFSRGGKPVRKLMALEPVIRESAGFALQGSNVRCEMAFADPLWPVEADEGQVGQVIANLVINAQQAMPEGGTIGLHATNVALTAHEAPPLPAGDYVKISVTDSGPGIEPALVPRIFDPFFTTKPKGSGLGLTTCYWIAKRHEGHLDVESRLGTGTAFHFYLPRSEQPVPLDEPQAQKARTRGRVLLMDDDDSVREAVEGMLVGLGYEVEGSRDGAEAVERFTNARNKGRAFDAVILDLTVRDGMGGKEALAKLLLLDPGVKAIVSSGYSNDPLMSDFQQAGFYARLSKPFEIEHLDEILSSAIAQRGA